MDTLVKRLEDLEKDALTVLALLTSKHVGLKLVSDEDIEGFEFGDIFEFRNEITGNVFDFHPIEILDGNQLKALDIDGSPLKGDHVSINQLSVDEKIRLIELIKEKI